MSYYSSATVSISLVTMSSPNTTPTTTTVSCSGPASPPGFGTCTGLPYTVTANSFLSFQWGSVGTAAASPGGIMTSFICK